MNPNSPTTNGRRHGPASALGLGAAVLLLAACGSSGTYGGAGSATPAAGTASGGVGTAKTSVGTVLTDGNGRTLYLLTADAKDRSTCTGSCVASWPVVPTTTEHAADVTATLGSLTRPDGTRQLTVDGMPAYTYAADTAAGNANGQGIASFGGTWWVLSTDGTPITSSSAPPMPGYGKY